MYTLHSSTHLTCAYKETQQYYTLVLLLIARTNFIVNLAKSLKLVHAKPRIMRIICNFYNAVLEKTLNLVRAKPKFFKIAKLSKRS